MSEKKLIQLLDFMGCSLDEVLEMRSEFIKTTGKIPTHLRIPSCFLLNMELEFALVDKPEVARIEKGLV